MDMIGCTSNQKKGGTFMNTVRIQRLCFSVLCGVLLATIGSAAAAPMVNLNGVQYVQYGDGQSYSLPQTINTNCGGANSGCQYYVQSGPGQIDNLVVLATGTNSGPTVTNFSGMDKAYSTPNGNGGAPFFSMNPGTNNGVSGTVNNNGANTWDASLAALKTFLSGEQMVFFFNNNQTSSGGASTQSLAGWAQIKVRDKSNNVLGTFDFTNNHGKYGLFTEGGGGTYLGDVGNYTSTGAAPLAGNNSATDYILSGGAICYQGGVPTSCANPHDSGPVNHNLGANQAAYAVLFPELNALLSTLFSTVSASDLALYTFSADVRLGCDAATAAGNCTGNGTTVPYGRDLNNGYEQLFMGTAASLNVPNIPEPGSLALFALALGLLAWRVRRSQAH
jgi:hypothetical protein